MPAWCSIQTFIIIDWNAVLWLSCRPYPALGLLGDMPGFVRQKPFLPRRDVDFSAPGIGQGIELQWLR